MPAQRVLSASRSESLPGHNPAPRRRVLHAELTDSTAAEETNCWNGAQNEHPERRRRNRRYGRVTHVLVLATSFVAGVGSHQPPAVVAAGTRRGDRAVVLTRRMNR